MKKNKQYLPILLFILMGTFTLAQAQTEVKIIAGANYSTIHLEDDAGDTESTQFTPGFQIGIGVDIPITHHPFYIQPSILYSRKGFKQENSDFAGRDNNLDVTASYFELPVNFLYKPVVGKGKLLLGAGPYLGYGTGGEWESDEAILIGDVIHDDHGDVMFDDDIKNAEWGKYFYGKPWDYGANFVVGYEFFDTLLTQFHLRLGIADLAPEINGEEPESTRKNLSFGISLGYKL